MTKNNIMNTIARMIDKISYKIMNELRSDGRATNVELAQKLGISVATVAKKINTMIDKGVIVINAMPDPAIMGYQVQSFIGLSVEPNKINKICKDLTENIHVHMVTNCLGRFDILLIVFFQDSEMLHDFIKEDLMQIKGINSVKSYFRANDNKWNEGVFSTDNKPAVIDELDHKIIAELIRNGRHNYADLAKKLGVSKPTISRRITFLLKKSVIRIIAIPNPSKIGYTANAYAVVNIDYSKIDSICEKLAGYSEIHFIMRIMNDFDIAFGVYSTNLETLYKFLQNSIGNIDGIIKIETFICGDFFYLRDYRINRIISR